MQGSFLGFMAGAGLITYLLSMLLVKVLRKKVDQKTSAYLTFVMVSLLLLFITAHTMEFARSLVYVVFSAVWLVLNLSKKEDSKGTKKFKQNESLLVSETKICLACGEKNNPSFSSCWKCKGDLNFGSDLQGDLRKAIKVIGGLLENNQYVEADEKLNDLEIKIKELGLDPKSVLKLRIACNMGLLATMQGVASECLRESGNTNEVRVIDQAKEFHLKWYGFAKEQASMLEMDPGKLKQAMEMNESELMHASLDSAGAPNSKLRAVLHEKAKAFFLDLHEQYVATCMSDALLGMMLLDELKKKHQQKTGDSHPKGNR